ncbi:MAG: hypothetical protein HGA67_00525 [Candidatus Yonathbacteria bacterium]|nr:hypothetical protein [Candidatus Yonathbacteria bacterium]
MKENIVKREYPLYTKYSGDLSLVVNKVKPLNDVVLQHGTLVQGGVFIAQCDNMTVNFEDEGLHANLTLVFYKKQEGVPKKFFGVRLPTLTSSSVIEYEGERYIKEWKANNRAMPFYKNKLSTSTTVEGLRDDLLNEKGLRFDKNFLLSLFLPIFNPLLQDFRIITG